MTRQAKLITSRSNTDGTFNAVLEDVATKERFEIKNAHAISIADSQSQSFDGVPMTMSFSLSYNTL